MKRGQKQVKGKYYTKKRKIITVIGDPIGIESDYQSNNVKIIKNGEVISEQSTESKNNKQYPIISYSKR